MSDDRLSEERVTHSPGPWLVRKGDEWTTDIFTKHKPDVSDDSDEDWSWNVASCNRLRDEWQANARLIAAAPDLLEALRGLYLDQMDYLTINNLGGENNHWMVAARLAIKKATQP